MKTLKNFVSSTKDLLVVSYEINPVWTSLLILFGAAFLVSVFGIFV